MKQNLYIPGDLVMAKDDVVMINEVENAAAYKDPFIYATCINKRKSFYKQYSELKPIPLTSEILEKNGWKKENVGYSTKNQDPIFLYKDNGGGWAVEIGDEFISVISFVHQLQHLLFGLGLDSNMIV